MTDVHLRPQHVQRYNQIPIRLHYVVDGAWHRTEAQQWNERGFSFYHAQTLPLAPLEFKRSLQHFEGELVWTRSTRDEAQVLEMLCNEAIQRQADQMQAQPETQQRLWRLMRIQGMLEAKQQVLTALGNTRTEAQWQALVQERMQLGLFHSGVRVDSSAWNAVVADALALGGVVTDLEKWSDALGGP
ncbi:hypothetical protein [Rhodoferax sp. OV413]|uniref:hypothetical protein n=1 Tax=Rhodoferax sp. OV413 TaxID=1855285 RepID=UPI0025E31B61|nr:hypothetical protein [Rhodoferax sp. OV413]